MYNRERNSSHILAVIAASTMLFGCYGQPLACIAQGHPKVVSTPRMAQEISDLVDLAYDYKNKAVDAVGTKNYPEAERLGRMAVQVAEQARDKNDPLVAHMLCDLADTLLELNKWGEAEDTYKRALIIFDSVQAPEREPIWKPAGAISGMLRGGKHYGQCEKIAAWQGWLASRHSDEHARNLLADQLDDIGEHPMEKRSLPSGWAPVVQRTNVQLDQYLSNLQKRIRESYKGAGGESPVLLFDLSSDGWLVWPRLEKSSGSIAQDQSALLAVKRLGYMVSPPPLGNRTKATIEMPLDSRKPRMRCE